MSSKGNKLRLYTTPGIGGDCSNDEFSFTLVQKLATKTEGVYFTEYTTEDSGYPTTGLKIDSSNIDANNIDVGYKGSGICQSRIGLYSVVYSGEEGGSENEIFVKIIGSGKPATDSGKYTTYKEIEDDTEFVTMLKSLEVK